jgi:hypothetical protein
VYFIQQGDTGPIKIGYTETLDSLSGRMSGLQTGNPHKLWCLATIDGTIADEHALHDRFKESHIRGEWFAHSQELIYYIRSLSLLSHHLDAQYQANPLLAAR